jgi:hypothetical protein
METGEAGTPRDVAGDTPLAAIVYPIGDYICGAAIIPCDELEIAWAGDDGSGSDGEIAGYQVKLIAAPSCADSEQVVSYLTNPLYCPDEIARNLAIPSELIVDDAVPLTDSTYHACDWYPKKTSPVPGASFLLPTVPETGYAAVRAVDIDGNVTPPEAFAFADGESGNILPLELYTGPVPDFWLLTVHEQNTGATWSQPHLNPTGYVVNMPAGYPFDIDWESGRVPCGPLPDVETAYAVDMPNPGCASCTDPDGIGGWSPWGPPTGELPFPLEFGEEAIGEVHTLHIKMRDLGYSPFIETIATIELNVYGGSFERPALWLDDFIVSGLNDCEHDAILRPWLDNAVRPHIRVQEGIAMFAAHASGIAPCSESSLPILPDLDRLLRYRMLFWSLSGQGTGSAAGGLTANPTTVNYGSDELARYVRAGGGVVVWGRNTIGHVLGDYFPQDTPYEPELPSYTTPDFGPGTFVWDIMKLRTTFDSVGRGTSRRLSQACSGIVGLEATSTAIAEGYPVGVLDPSGYSTDPSNTTVTPRTAIWLDTWQGRQNPFGTVATAPIGAPPLHVTGMDTLYTYVSNSWAYLEDGGNAIRDVCGVAFLSDFEGEPIVIRYDDPLHGRVVWIGTTLWNFAENHEADIQLILEKLAAWVLEEG